MKIRYKILLSLLVLVTLLFIVTLKTYLATESVNFYRNQTVLLEKQLLMMTNLRAQVRNQLLENYEVGFVEDLKTHEIDLTNERLEVAKKFKDFEVVFDSKDNQSILIDLNNSYQELDTSLQQVTSLLKTGEIAKAKLYLLEARQEKFNNGFIKKISYLVEQQKRITLESSKKLESSILTLQQEIISFFVGSLVIVFILVIFVFQSIGKRLFELEIATRKISDGNFNIQLSEQGTDEVSGLTKAFNQMVTSLMEAREKLTKQQEVITHTSKMSALGEMAGGIAHEINTPLAAIILNAEMIDMINSESSFVDPEIQKRTDTIISISNRVAKIITGLRGFSRNAIDDEKEDFIVEELINSTLDLCNEKFKNHGVFITINPDLLDTQVCGQIVQLSQVLMNLLNNSFDAIQDIDDKWIELNIEIKDNMLQLRISDSGTKISNEVAEKIFNPFFTTKEVGKGTGLGLSISKSIAKQQGGDLIFDNESQHTCFIILIPLA